MYEDSNHVTLSVELAPRFSHTSKSRDPKFQSLRYGTVLRRLML